MGCFESMKGEKRMKTSYVNIGRIAVIGSLVWLLMAGVGCSSDEGDNQQATSQKETTYGRAVQKAQETVAALANPKAGFDPVCYMAIDENAVMAPMFEVDPFWPQPLPNHWTLGSVLGVGIDAFYGAWRSSGFPHASGRSRLSLGPIYGTSIDAGAPPPRPIVCDGRPRTRCGFLRTR